MRSLALTLWPSNGWPWTRSRGPTCNCNKQPKRRANSLPTSPTVCLFVFLLCFFPFQVNDHSLSSVSSLSLLHSHAHRTEDALARNRGNGNIPFVLLAPPSPPAPARAIRTSIGRRNRNSVPVCRSSVVSRGEHHRL